MNHITATYFGILPKAVERRRPKQFYRLPWCLFLAWLIFVGGQVLLLKIFEPFDVIAYGTAERRVVREIDDVSMEPTIKQYPENKHHDRTDRFLSPFVTDFIRSHSRDETNRSTHMPYRQQICEKDKIDHVLDGWKENHHQLVCQTRDSMNAKTDEGGETIPRDLSGDFMVDEYILTRWENQPTIFRYKNVKAFSMRGPRPMKCNRINNRSNITAKTLDEAKGSMTQFDIVGNQIYVNATVIRIVLFDVSNPYERFHAYINVAMIMIMFDIRDPQLVLIATERNERDTEMWRLFSEREPIFVLGNVETTDYKVEFSESTTKPEENSKAHYQFREIIDAPTSGLSMINAKSTLFDVERNKTIVGSLRGRGVDHECQSLLFQAIIEWIKRRAIPMHHPENDIESGDPEVTDSRIKILWSSRQPYRCRNNSTVTPSRIMGNEEQWIASMSSLLGQRYNITMVDFGTLSVSESIQAVEQSNIMVGVHGAGLMWSVFLPLPPGASSGKRFTRSGLVEIFGGDRNPTNRHYHNIASLMGIQYRETAFWKGSSSMFRWNEMRLNEVVSQIFSIHHSNASEQH